MNSNKLKELAELLYPQVTETPEDLYKKYPPRRHVVTRIAPSPTGYLHIGTLGMCICDIALAQSFGGKVLLRIEDTDQKREVKNATLAYVKILDRCGIKFDEGFDGEKNYGSYGPYIQSHRIHLYHVFAKRLVELGRAYPCFCDEEDLAKTREKQETLKQKTGYYGKYATCRSLSLEQVQEKLTKKMPWALRADFSKYSEAERITWHDLVRGNMSLPAEINDPVIIKSNGIPPYNFAHVVDDTLMRVTHVLRGEEWLVSAAQHIQLFRALDLPHPNYLHMPVICVEEDGHKRKLSKRKDKEAVVENFLADGYPPEALIEYLMTLYNTDFELWRIKNPNSPYQDFKFKAEKIGSNSPLFDWNKLNDISKNVIAKMSCGRINNEVKNFYAQAKESGGAHANGAGKILDTKGNLDKLFAMLAIDRETEKPRKDIIKYGDIWSLYNYIFNDANTAFKKPLSVGDYDPALVKKVLVAYEKIYNPGDTKDEWFTRIKKLCTSLGFADNIKEYKQNPTVYHGHVGDITQIIRLAFTGHEHTPDLYRILQIMFA